MAHLLQLKKLITTNINICNIWHYGKNVTSAMWGLNSAPFKTMPP